MSIPSSSERRHDLDALRAITMLLGIAMHGSLAFIEFPWPIQNSETSPGLALIFFAVHGFWMPVFFVMSGFFTAMLWRMQGLKSLLWHRFRRIFLPLMLGCVTIVPITNWIYERAIQSALQRAIVAEPFRFVPTDSGLNIWIAARTGNLEAIKAHLANKVDLSAQDSQAGLTPLSWAALMGNAEVVEHLIKSGANVNGKNSDGGIPLHEAVFMGQDEIVALLLQNGAEMDATDNQGKTPLNRARVRSKYTHARAAALQIKLYPLRLANARRRVVNLLSEYENTGKIQYKYDTVWRLLTTTEIFEHLWFLWVLCWLVLAFALYAAIVDWMQWTGPSQKFILSPLRYLWVIPLTMLAQWFMAAKGNVPNFGPDVSSTILPAPYMLVYYGTFFFFGVLYYDSGDCAGEVGKRWAITLPIGVSIIFPLGLTFGVLSFIEPVFGLIPGSLIHHLISVAMQAVYAWLMVFSLMGAFRRLMSRESKRWRYISDSSYWLYLAHLPLVIAAQQVVQMWQVPLIVKFSLICITVTGLLLLSYQFLVRYTFVGTLLNGPRQRPQKVVS